MFDNQRNVQEFMTTFGQNISETLNTNVDKKTLALRVSLLMEEVLEFAEAAGVSVYNRHGDALLLVNKDKLNYEDNKSDPDFRGMGDALADIDYVNLGAANVLGLDVQKLNAEAHRSNMTKLWSEDDLVYLPKNGVEVVEVSSGKDGIKYIVRRSDGKVLKSPSYSDADFDPVKMAIDYDSDKETKVD